MCPTLMWGKLCGKSLLVEVLKSDGCGLNVGNPTNIFRSVYTRRCQYVYFQNSPVYGLLKYVVT